MLLLNLGLAIEYNHVVSTLLCIDTHTHAHSQYVSISIYTHRFFKLLENKNTYLNVYLKLSANNSATADVKLL